MVEFATRGVGISSPRTLSAFTSIGSDPELVDAITASLELAVITSVGMLALLLPTMIWIRLRLPRMVRPVELVCLTPLTIPAIVLVVGFAPIYRWIEINVSDSILTPGVRLPDPGPPLLLPRPRRRVSPRSTSAPCRRRRAAWARAGAR